MKLPSRALPANPSLLASTRSLEQKSNFPTNLQQLKRAALLVALCILGASTQSLAQSGDKDSTSPAQPAPAQTGAQDSPSGQSSSQSSAKTDSSPAQESSHPATQESTPPAQPSSKQCSASDAMQCVNDILHDQAHIWTSPFRLRANDAKWLLPFGAAFGTAFHFDTATASAVGTPRTWATHVSTYGQPTILAGASVGLYGLGSLVHNDRLRSTGINGAEAIVDTMILTEGLKLTTARFRPTQDVDQDGDFWSKGVRVNSSMPSGHAAASWAFAKVIASEYPDKKWLGWLAYGGAAAISTSRIFAMQHFPSDVVAGSVFGYLTGAYVSRRSSKTVHGVQLSLAPAYDPTSRSYGVTLNLSGK